MDGTFLIVNVSAFSTHRLLTHILLRLGKEVDIFLEWGRKTNYSPYGGWLSSNL